MGQIAYLAKQGGDAVFNTVFVGRLIAQSGTTLRGNLVVSGSITAQTLIVNTTSVYSGSTRFGSIIGNTHQFTGSIQNSGSITTIGSVTAASFVGSGASLTSIPNSALNNSTISGIALGSNLANLTVDDSSLQFNTTTTYNGNAARTISVKALGITNAMLAGSIANAKLTNSTISGIALGSNLATLTIGTGLSGTSYNGSGAVTIANTGVTSIVAGTGISINQGTGAVTVTNSISNTNQLTNGAGFITSAGNTATSTRFSSGQTNWVSTGILDSVIGMIAWKNYGNNHVIFDASNSKTPSGTDCNNANPGVAWTGTYPTLMGWNGTNTYGVRVDSAKVADSANSVAWTNVSSRPTALSQFSNDLGNYGSWITAAGTAAAINQTVAVDTNANLVYSQMGSNDFFRIRVGGGSNAGYVEIATADDGTEPIYVRQYTGVFSDVTRTATLLDGSGNTSFPGNISGGYILGSYFNASAGNSENPTIGQIWTQNTTDNYLRKSTPAHLISQLGLITTGNYTSYTLPLSGGTLTNTSTNTILTLSGVEPHLRIAATGGSNVAGVVIAPTTGYDAFVGNFNGGALNLMANSNRIVQVTNSNGVIFYVGSHGPVAALGNNTSAYYILVNESSSNKTWDITLYNNNFYINESNIDARLRLDAGGGLFADYYSDFSDIRYKNVLETNPTVDLSAIDVIKYIRHNDDTNRVTYGYSAQQVQTILPSAVIEDSKDNRLSVVYKDIQILKIAALERKVADLQSQINDLKSK
jgi:hypothetical protein